MENFLDPASFPPALVCLSALIAIEHRPGVSPIRVGTARKTWINKTASNHAHMVSFMTSYPYVKTLQKYGMAWLFIVYFLVMTSISVPYTTSLKFVNAKAMV